MDRLEVKFAADATDAATGLFSGYGAVFGNVDSHGDVIAPGAFRETLSIWQGKGRLPPMKLMHGTTANPFTGDDLPIGVWTKMAEDVRGLYVEGKISAPDTDYGKRMVALMKDGALGGLSIGYRPVKFTRGAGPSQPKRTLESVALMEVSVVDEPSNTLARFDIKTATEMTIREVEEALARGMLPPLTAREAKALLSGGFKALAAERDAGATETDVMASLRRLYATLKT